MAKKPAGYHERRIIEEALPRLSRAQRTAFAAGCAERVLPLVEYHFGHARQCRAALALAWRFALDEPVDHSELAAYASDCDALVDELYEDGETGGVLCAVNASWYALESVSKVEVQPAQRAAWEAQDAAGSDDEHSDEFSQEEAEWQVLALKICESQVPTRSMFDALPSDSGWLRALKNKPWPQR